MESRDVYNSDPQATNASPALFCPDIKETTVKFNSIAVALLGIVLISSAGCAEAPEPQSDPTTQPVVEPTTQLATQPATQPATTPASQPSTQPIVGPALDLDDPKVLASVGEKKLTMGQVNQIIEADLGKMPPEVRQALTDEQIAGAQERIIDAFVKSSLISAYAETLPVSDADVAVFKKTLSEQLAQYNITVEQFMAMQGLTEEALRQQAKMSRIQREAVSDEKVAELIAAGPVSHFDGTKVQASHILIASGRFDSPAAKKAAREKLEKIAEGIKAGNTDFAEAAKENSSCPSSLEGGDLGEFSFERMVLPFSEAAFAIDVDEVSDIVVTPFGYHLIKVTGRTAGDGKAGPQAQEIARSILMFRLEQDLLDKAMAANKVVINK